MQIKSMDWQGRHEDPHAIPLMERISNNSKRPFVFMGLEDGCQPLICEDLLQLKRVTCPSMSGEILGLNLAPL